MGQPENLRRGPAGGRLQPRSGGSLVVHHLEFAVHDHAGRRVLGEEHLLSGAPDLGGAPMHLGPPRHLAVGKRCRLPGAAAAWRHLDARRPRAAQKDLAGAIEWREQSLDASRRLGRPQRQVSAGPERVMHVLQHPPLQYRIQIDQQVAAQHHVQLGKGRIARDVVPGEYAHVPQPLGHPVAVIERHEVLFQARSGNVRCDALGVLAQPRDRQRRVAHVGGKDADGKLGTECRFGLQECDRQRIGLLARGASDDPDPYRGAATPACSQCRNDGGPQRLECRGLPKEPRNLNQDRLEERADLVGLLPQPLQVISELRHPDRFRAALDTSHQAGPLVVPEIHAGGVLKYLDCRFHSFGVASREVGHRAVGVGIVSGGAGGPGAAASRRGV